MSTELPNVHYGEVGDEGADQFTPAAEAEFDERDDDELLPETPRDVIEMLGFDPLDATLDVEEDTEG